MTPATPTPPAPWWQSLLATLLGAVVTGLLNHYAGPTAATVGGAAAVGVAHALPSPFQQK